MKYNKRIPAHGPIRGLLMVSGILTGLFGWVFGVLGAVDSSIPGWQRLLLFGLLGILMGTLISVWLARMAIVVKVTDESLSASLWPLSKMVVGRPDIERVEKVVIDPLNDYGGWGIKGKKSDRLYGMSGISGVRVHHKDGQLTLLVDDPDLLEETLVSPAVI